MEMKKRSFCNNKTMVFEIGADELKDALFQHFRKSMTADEEAQYLEGKPQMSINFHSYSPSVLQLEIKVK